MTCAASSAASRLRPRAARAGQNLRARQTPVAGDLRLVLAMLHVYRHLERMSDYCVTIAKLVKLAPSVAPDRMFVDARTSSTPGAERVAYDAS